MYFHCLPFIFLDKQELSFCEVEELLLFHMVICLPDSVWVFDNFFLWSSSSEESGQGRAVSFNQDENLTSIYTLPLRLVILEGNYQLRQDHWSYLTPLQLPRLNSQSLYFISALTSETLCMWKYMLKLCGYMLGVCTLKFSLE